MKYKKWSIWRANLDPVVGSEQGKSRPVIIIIENDINKLLNAVNILPITSRKPGREVYPNEVLISASKTGLDVESIALCHQIRTIDKKRLSKLYGNIGSKKVQREVLEALTFQLGINIE